MTNSTSQLRVRGGIPAIFGLTLALLVHPAQGQEPAPAPRDAPVAGPALATLSDGRPLRGQLRGNARDGFQFLVESTGHGIPLADLRQIQWDAPPARSEPPGAASPFRVGLGFGQVLSSQLRSLDREQLVVLPADAAEPVHIPRAAVGWIRQPAGEVRVLDERFETLDETRWRSRVGRPALAGDHKLEGQRSLRLAADGSALTLKLDEPVEAGRFTVAFDDGGSLDPSQRWFVDLSFRGRGGDLATVRIVGGWSEETLAVESPGGPRLAVQPLVRREGWHQLVVRFGPEELALAVDGNELAHGPGANGSLVEIRLASSPEADTTAEQLAVHLDDLSLVRFTTTPASHEVEPSLDELQLTSGDQLFGVIDSADAQAVRFGLDAMRSSWPWSEVVGLRLRRTGPLPALVTGQLALVEWRAAGLARGQAANAESLDRVEGTLQRADAERIEVEVPRVGRLTIPSHRLTRLEPRGRVERLVIDGSGYHLGDRFVAALDAPAPDPNPLALEFELARPPEGPVELVLDVIDVLSTRGSGPFTDLVQQGQLRTRVRLNDRELPDLNTVVQGRNDRPERVRLPIPGGTLLPGRNRLRFEQTGTASDPARRDNLGILGIAIEAPLAAPRTMIP